ncbi:hypothetical protein AVEN_173651-1 [Araneus ventricosus]|uniref:Uncharacterized protein n=1 Tax=Araneus ventricosus TaxID=182803 RepID=A0A4Y2WX52_ARAVE|nr:hypothetical protein AVEN_173651-1 [Araneus ventricosus]
MLMSRFQTTRIFWNGTRNYEQWSDHEDDTCVGMSSPNFRTTMGGSLSTKHFLTWNRSHTGRIFSGIGFRTWRYSASKSEILSPWTDSRLPKFMVVSSITIFD